MSLKLLKENWSVGGFSVFRRIFTLYSLTIVLIYIILIVLFVNNISHSSNELITVRELQNRAFIESLDQQLDNIFKQQEDLTTNSQVTKLAYSIYSDNYEKNVLVLELLQRLESIKSLNPLVEDLSITFPSEQMTISTKDGYMKESQYNWKSFIDNEGYDRIFNYEDQVTLNFTYPLMYSLSEDYVPDYSIDIYLSEQELVESLNVLGLEKESSGVIWFDLNEDRFVVNRESQSIHELMTNPSFQKALLSGEEQTIQSRYEYVSSGSFSYPIKVITFIDKQLLFEIIIRYIVLLTVIMIIISALFVFSLVITQRLLVKPVQELMTAFEKIREGSFEVRIYHEPHDEFNYLYNAFNETTAHIEELIANLYDQECLLQNAELAQLQSQINPHFLYNSFFIINRMAKNEAYEPITRFVTSLAKYYRFINKETHMYIRLDLEIEHMKNYIDIQQIRFSEKISVEEEELPQAFKEILVPKLILQPIVENAYIYGMANILEDGKIKISYEERDPFVMIAIEDNGEDADDQLIAKMRGQLEDSTYAKENHALTNIDKRLKLAYGIGSGVEIERSSLGGVKVVLVVNTKVNSETQVLDRNVLSK